MTVNPEHLKAFESIKWATLSLNDSDWCVRQRTRGSKPEDLPDRYCKDTLYAYDGMQQWVELYQRPSAGSHLVTKSISLCKYGPGLTGFPTICHGGAVMSMMDEALAFSMVANEAEAAGRDTNEWVDIYGGKDLWKKLVEEGQPIDKALKGFMATANLNLKFLRPVLCPGVVGIEVTMLENKGHKMKIRGIMKDGNGTPLVQADGLWVKLGGSKL